MFRYKTIILALVFSLVTSLLIPLTVSKAHDIRSVSSYWLTVRSGPSYDHATLDYIKNGTKVEVEKEYSNGYAYVTYHNEKKGYVHSGHLKSLSHDETSTNDLVITKKEVDVKIDQLNVRKGPSTNYDIIGKLQDGTVVDIHRFDGNWAYMSSNDLKGYVHQNYLKDVQPLKPQIDEVKLEQERKLHKVRYGDTLWSLSRQFNTTISSLKELNELNNDFIVVGDSVVVSGTKPKMDRKIPENSEVVNLALTGKTIVLDPGHGDSRSGAVANGLVEKELALNISLRVQKKLEKLGAKVIMTRTGDTDCDSFGSYTDDLNCRPAIATKHNADIFVSIHGNAYVPSAKGAEAFYYHSRDKKLAHAVQNAYIKETGLHYRRVAHGNYRVLRQSTVPSTLFEMGFLTNKNDAYKMKQDNFQDKMAQGITNGIVHYFK